MRETVRFGVSMDKKLVELLDNLTQQEGHENRSETLRRLVRKELVSPENHAPDRDVIGTVTLLYHYKTRLPRVEVTPYPSVRITANLQLHATDDIRVKVLVIKGKDDEVYRWAQELLSRKNITGKLSIAGTDEIFNELAK